MAAHRKALARHSVIFHILHKEKKDIVGLSNILDSELCRRKPTKRSHRKVVGTTIVDRKLLSEVLKRIEGVTGIEPLLVFAVAAFNLAIMARSVGTDELVTDTQLSGGILKQCGNLSFTVGETVGELKAVVRLNALDPYAPAGIPLDQPLQEISGRVGGLLGISGEETQTGELVDGGILEQAQFGVCDAFTGNHLHIHLDTLTGICHLFIGLRGVLLFRLFCREQAHFAQDAEQAFRAAGVAALAQAVPELQHAECRIPAAHIADELQLSFRVLIWMTVGPSGLAGQGRHTSVPALFPEVDVRTAFVVLPAGAADTVFFCVLHQGLPVGHVLCYTLVHEEYGLLSGCCVVTQL